jgi:hypothetical protein
VSFIPLGFVSCRSRRKATDSEEEIFPHSDSRSGKKKVLSSIFIHLFCGSDSELFLSSRKCFPRRRIRLFRKEWFNLHDVPQYWRGTRHHLDGADLDQLRRDR